MKILTQFDGWALIALFFVVMSAIVLCLRKRTQTKAEFLAAGHSAPWLLTAFSMAATWVWAPSMFTAKSSVTETDCSLLVVMPINYLLSMQGIHAEQSRASSLTSDGRLLLMIGCR